MSPKLPRGTIILVALAAATIIAIGMSGIRAILAPTILTLVLTICANPVRTGLLKRGVPGGIATGSVILVVFGLLAAFTFTIIVALGQFAAMLPNYAAQFAEIGANISHWLQSIGIGQAQVQDIATGLDPGKIAAFITGALGSVAGITGALVVILTMMILMAADSVYARAVLGQVAVHRPELVVALRNYAGNVRRYMVYTTILGVVQGVLNAIALVILQVPAALLWGLLAFLCSFIPNIGYFFALIPPLIFGFLVGGWPTAIAVLVIYGLINAIVQSVIQPRVIGNAVSLSQTITFFSVLFWAVIIGPVGAILAIPLTLFAKTVLIDANPDAQWWRPALGPTEETRKIAKDESLAAKQNRRSRHSAQTTDSASEPASGPPVP